MCLVEETTGKKTIDDDDICPDCNGTGYTTAWVNTMPEVATILVIGVIILNAIIKYFNIQV